jgi:MoaA/NifB/PqqE/SkfB family radical SAM enzyme
VKDIKAKRVISWNICSGCNYGCSYCTQGKAHTGFPSPEQMSAFTDFFHDLGRDGGWEVKISGGEPFFYPGFIDAVEKLVDAGMTISVVTNFSFPRRLYRRFLAVVGDRLRSFSVSLHREKVDWRDFLRKCRWIAGKIAGTEKGSLVVNSVVEPGRVSELPPIKRAFEEGGIRFYPQLMRKKGRPVDYGPEEIGVIRDLAGDRNPFEINLGYSLKGRTCYAGMYYFIITPEGRCYTCYPGKRDGAGYMGDIVAGDFAFRETPLTCPYDVCPCTVPINRGMISPVLISPV